MNGREAVGRLQKCLSGRSGLSSRLKKYKWVGLVLLVGLLLLAWPAGKENQAGTAAETPQTFDLAATEARLSEALSQIRGAGEVTVVLTLAGGPRQVLAQDVDQATERGQERRETVVVSRGSGGQEAVAVQEVSPEYQGALLVCPGGGDPTVRLQLTQAVAALTAHGLTAQVTQIAVSRSRAAGSLHLLMANNPVFLIARE